ncbi:hypothetical protein AAC387_Pa06g0417 [Persea americana]
MWFRFGSNHKLKYDGITEMGSSLRVLFSDDLDPLRRNLESIHSNLPWLLLSAAKVLRCSHPVRFVDLGFDVSSLGTRSAREFCFGWRDGIPSIDWLLVEDEEGMR